MSVMDRITPEQRSRIMSRIRGRDTKPEVLVRERTLLRIGHMGKHRLAKEARPYRNAIETAQTPKSSYPQKQHNTAIKFLLFLEPHP